MKPGRGLQPPRPRSRFACGPATTRLRHPGGPRGAAPRMRLQTPITPSKPGELAGPSSAQPLLVIGDVSALRVRVELEERDFGEIKIGQPVLVRAAAFRGREFAGKVSFIAPIVEQGRINARGRRDVTDVDVVEVLVDLAQADPLAVGMKVDVYFQPDGR